MSFEALSLIAVGLISITSLLLLISRDWRLSILALAGQYAGVFLLVWLSWPLELAIVKMIAGWMAGAILGTSLINLGDPLPARSTVNRFFRVLASGLSFLFVFSIAPRVVAWVPNVALVQVWGGLILVIMGFLHLGLTGQPFRVILGLLTVLAGFEIVYAAVESSTLVAGLLAGVNLALAMVGAYLLVSPTMEEPG